MPRTGLSPAELKERAIDIAQARIRRDGFDRVRLSDIARDLAVSHVALYKHFPDRASLIDAVAERWLEEVDEELETVLKSPFPIHQRLRLFFIRFHQLKLEKVRRDPESYRAFDYASAMMKPFVIAHMKNTLRQVNDLVTEAMEAGLIQKGDPQPASLILLESTMAFHHPKLVSDRIEEDREPQLKAVLEAVLKGLA